MQPKLFFLPNFLYSDMTANNGGTRACGSAGIECVMRDSRQ